MNLYNSLKFCICIFAHLQFVFTAPTDLRESAEYLKSDPPLYINRTFWYQIPICKSVYAEMEAHKDICSKSNFFLPEVSSYLDLLHLSEVHYFSGDEFWLGHKYQQSKWFDISTNKPNSFLNTLSNVTDGLVQTKCTNCCLAFLIKTSELRVKDCSMRLEKTCCASLKRKTELQPESVKHLAAKSTLLEEKYEQLRRIIESRSGGELIDEPRNDSLNWSKVIMTCILTSIATILIAVLIFGGIYVYFQRNKRNTLPNVSLNAFSPQNGKSRQLEQHPKAHASKTVLEENKNSNNLTNDPEQEAKVRFLADSK